MSLLSLKQTDVLLHQQFRDARVSGNFGPTEFQTDTNRIARSMIRAYKREFGDVWLGKINLYNEQDREKVLIQYRGGKIFNFACCFIVPRYDKQLVTLILAKNDAFYEGTRIASMRLDKIFNRIDKLNGRHIFWV